MKIVVRAPNWIGDSVLALPAIESLSHNFPGAEIWIAGREWVKDLFLSLDFVQDIIPLQDPSHWSGIREAAKTIKEHNFDVGVLLPNSFSSALLFFLAKIPQRWGYARDGRQLLLTKRVRINRRNPSVHQAQYYLNLIEGLGLKTSPGALRLKIDNKEINKARARLESLGIEFTNPLIVLNPGAHYGSAKRWPVSRFAELAALLQTKKKAEVLITGSSDELDLAEEISSLMKVPPLILSGQTTLPQLAGLLCHAHLFISNDSGPMHMAIALKVPVVAIFGPTDPRLTGPYQQPSTILKKDVDCWPCLHRECPTDHRCMVNISAEDVYEACEAFLK